MSRRGFALVEILAGLLLLSVLGLALAGGERWLLLAMTRTARWLLARDRGRRVIAFVEPRLLHAGLGLAACREGGTLHRVFGEGSNAPLVAFWPDSCRFIRIYQDTPTLFTPVEGDGSGVLRGTSFAVLYARGPGVFLRAPDGESLTLLPGGTAGFDVLHRTPSDAGLLAGAPRDLRCWGALSLAGVPLRLVSGSGGRVSLSLASAAPSPVEVPPVSELLPLCCERFCARDGVFRFQGMERDWYPPALYPREEGILALWVEWRPGQGVLDLWVLASGGLSAPPGPVPRPPEWPEEAPWRSDFARHALCVSRASWRLENL